MAYKNFAFPDKCYVVTDVDILHCELYVISNWFQRPFSHAFLSFNSYGNRVILQNWKYVVRIVVLVCSGKLLDSYNMVAKKISVNRTMPGALRELTNKKLPCQTGKCRRTYLLNVR